MANAETIDSLLVSLGLDLDKKSFQNATDAIGDVKNKMLQFLAAAGVGAGFDHWTRGVAKMVGGLEDAAFAARTTVKEVEAMRHAFDALGRSQAEADATMRQMANIQRNIQMGIIPETEFSAIIAGLGTVDSMKALSKFLNETRDEQRKIRALTELGIAPGSPLHKDLLDGRIWDKYADAQARTSGISPELSDAAAEFTNQMAKLNTQFNELSKVIGGPLLSELNNLLKTADKFLTENKEGVAIGVNDVFSGAWYDKLMQPSREAGERNRAMFKSSWNYTKRNIGDALKAIGIETDLGRKDLKEVRSHPSWMDWLHGGPGKVMREASKNDASSEFDALPPLPAKSVSSGRPPLGIRNRNPGNLRFAGQAGASPGEGGFAQFETQESGLSALHRQLGLYFKRGKNTISSIVNTYAPGSENDVPAYIRALTKATGKGEHEALDFNDAETVKKLMHGIVTHEVGRGYVSMADIEGAVGGGGASFGGDESASFAQGAFSSPSQTLPGSNYSPSSQTFTQTNHVTIESSGNPDQDQRMVQRYTRNAADSMRSDVY